MAVTGEGRGESVSALRNATISTKLFLLLGMFAAAFVALVAMTFGVLQTVKVNGPVYVRIVEGKDLIADVLPPPAYIIESYLLVLQMDREKDPAKIESLADKSRALRREFEGRHDHWQTHIDEGPLRRKFLEDTYRPALEFFAVRDREYVPALRSGDRARAQEILQTRLSVLYEEHRQAIDSVVIMATQQNAALERDTAGLVSRRLVKLGVSSALVILAALIIGWRFSRGLSQRIRKATDAATKVAGGDLAVTVSDSLADEPGRLVNAVGTMTRNLGALVTRVRQASIDLIATANEIGASSKQQEATIQGFGASTSEIAAAVKQISATSQELLSTMESVAKVASEASSSAEHGREGLVGMDRTMRGLTEATKSVSAKLAVIRERATHINVVVATIGKVADQTNLLSVNAAIEAEKAGESGLGFLVLAREIRRLADQTAVATLDIDRMVREMQSAVSAGVMEMDKFSEDVRRGVDAVGSIGNEVGTIITQVETLSGRFDSVSDGMRSQSLGAQQIDVAMSHLVEGARTTGTSLREFNTATEALRGAVGSLRKEIAQFNVGN
jgi:methyl-accepting chemotaxis protein WspA